MSRLIESICVCKGEVRNLNFHQERVNRSRYKLIGRTDEIELEKFIQANLNDDFQSFEKLKCRILYDQKFHSIEFIPYQIRPILSLKLVDNNTIEYSFKFEDRSAFKFLKDAVEEDEILIVKNGQITDTSFSNIAFFDGKNWITPQSYLLNGVMRQSLIQEKKLIEEEINPKDLNLFFSFKLINAMIDLEESPALPISIIS